MRLIAVIAILIVSLSHALACGVGTGTHGAASPAFLVPPKLTTKQKAARAAEEDEKAGYVKRYTPCGDPIWQKPQDIPVTTRGATGLGS